MGESSADASRVLVVQMWLIDFGIQRLQSRQARPSEKDVRAVEAAEVVTVLEDDSEA
jgi:hypothetical protein